MTHRRRRGTSPAGPSSMPEDDDMLREILIRLPPEPSSLPRASAVCKRWLGLVTDPKFHRQLYAHHRKPPLLGVFSWTRDQGIVFSPFLGPADRMPLPPPRISSPYKGNHVLDCRHGLVLVGESHWKKEVVVWDPITGEQHRVAIPPEFKSRFFVGAVLCADDNQGHVHVGCLSSPFKVVLISTSRNEQHLACAYSSETGGWGNLMSSLDQLRGSIIRASTLVGNKLYWQCSRGEILEFDLDGQGLSVIMGPRVTNVFYHGNPQIVRAQDGVVGYAGLSYPHFPMWLRKVNDHGLATWVPWKTIEMDSIIGLPPQLDAPIGWTEIIFGYEEDTDVMFLKVNGSMYMVQLQSMQSKKLDETFTCPCHPFRSFYTPAIRGCNEADVLPHS